MATIASLMVNVLADVSDLKTSMAKAESSVSGFASAAKKAFIGIVSVQAIRNVAEYADTIGDLAKKTGTSTDFIQKAGYAAKITGGSMEGLANAVVFLQKGLAGGEKNVIESMQQLGLSITALKAMSPEEQFRAVTDALQKVTSSGEQSELTLKALGKTGRENLAAVREGFSKLGDEAAATGQIMDREAVASLGNFNDALDRSLTVGKSLLGSVLGPFVPMLESLASAVGYVATHFGHLVNAVWKVVDPFTKIREGFKEWGYYLGTIKPVGPAVEAVASSFDLASRAAKPLVMTLEQAATIEKTLTRELEANAEAMAWAEYRAAELAKAYLEAHEATVKFVPALSKLDGMLVQTLKGAGDAGSQFKFLGWQIQGVHETAMPKFIGLMPALTGNLTKMGQAAKTAGDHIKTGLFDVLRDFPNLMRQALTGGGGFSGAMKAVGSQIGSVLGSGLFEKLGQSLTGVLGKLGAKVGGAIFDMLPGIGGVIGAAVGPIFDKLLKTEGKKVNDLRDAYISAAGGFDVLAAKAVQAGTTINALLRADTVKDYEAAVASLNAALEKTAALQGELATLQAELAGRQVMDWKTAEDLIKKYGGTLDTLGQQFVAAKQAASWKDVWDDWQTLIDMGADVGGVLVSMQDEIQALVQESLRIGTEIPAQFQPLIAELIRTGQLFDASGTAITDLSQLQFGAPLVSELDKLIAKIDELIRALTQGLAPAIRDIPERLSVRVDWDVSDFPDMPGSARWDGPSYVAGTRGFQDFGGGTLAMLHGLEAVVPMSAAGDPMFSSAPVVTELRVLQAENQELRAALEALPRTLARSMRDVVLMHR